MTYRIRTTNRSVPLDEAHLDSWGDRLFLWLYDHRGALLAGGAVVLLTVAVVGGVLWTDQRRITESTGMLNKASRLIWERQSDNPVEAEQKLKVAVAVLKELGDKYPRTPAASMGLYNLGNALVQQNDVAGAIEVYQKAMLAYAGQPMMTGLIQQRLGYAYLQKGDREAAAKALIAVTEIPGALNRDHALFELARLEEAQGRPEGAIAHYQEIVKSYPGSPLASEATVRMKVMEVKKSADSLPPPAAPPSAPAAVGAKPAPAKSSKAKSAKPASSDKPAGSEKKAP